MSKMVTFRMTDEMAAQLDAATGNRSAFILEAVREKLDGRKSESEEPIKIISPTKESASQKSASPFDESASAIKTAAAPAIGGCPKHGSECGWRKAGGWWCSKDGQVY